MKKLRVHIGADVFIADSSATDVTVENGAKTGTVSAYTDKTGKTRRFLVNRITETEYEIWIGNTRIAATIEDATHPAHSGADTGASSRQEIVIKSPMPGLVVALDVAEGAEVLAGAGLLILEAMKMENEIKATAKARVKKISVEKGDKVEKGAVLMVLENIGV